VKFVKLKKININRILNGHPWVFDNEIDKMRGIPLAGEVVDVLNFDKTFIGKGFYNPNSKIRVRILSRNQDELLDDEFFYNRIKSAYEYRLKLGHKNAFRVVFGEADFLSGLVVDKYGEYLVSQILSLGMEGIRDSIVSILKEVLAPKAIIARNDVSSRIIEGLNTEKEILYGEYNGPNIILENEFKFSVDLLEGQKTGYFLDQKENRATIKRYISKNDTCIDFFSHVGSFAVHCAGYGAKEVEAVDISSTAMEQVKVNATLNNIKIDNYTVTNAFDYLKKLVGAGKKYNVVILDPPAFTKNKQNLDNAYRGYKEINLRGMKIMEEGGYLITCSCSQNFNAAMFQKMALEAARDAKKVLRLVDYRTQSTCHPIIPAIEETLYLKFFVYQVFSL